MDDPAISAPGKAEEPTHAPVCRVCDSEITENQLVRPCRLCTLPWCYACVDNCFTGALNDLERMPPNCCGRAIHHSVANGILEPEKYEAYKGRYEELSTPRPFYCPVPNCSVFVPPRKLSRLPQLFDCPQCGTLLCQECRRMAQQNHLCKPAEDTVVATILAFKYKQCPRCKTGVLRMYGCDHMRCLCGAHWCWECTRAMDVCRYDPCSARLDDGEYADSDVQDDSDGDDSDRDDEVDTPSSPSEAVADGESSSASQEPTPPEVADSEVEHENTADASTTPAPETPPTSTDVPTAPEAPPSPPPEINLDDPDEENWERESLDFGNEPSGVDVWGCSHRFRCFDRDRVQDWLRVGAFDCQNCFEPISLEQGPPAGEGGEKEKEGGGSAAPTEEGFTGDAFCAEASGPSPSSSSPPAHRGKRPRLAWECKKCGVLFCRPCRDKVKSKRA